MVQKEEGLPGITLNNHRYKISLYADDTTIFLRDPHREVPILWALLRRFERATGMKINDTKTEGLPMGKYRRETSHQEHPQVDTIGWLKEGEYLVGLGAPVGYKFDEQAFWVKKYKKFKARLARYAHTAHLIPTENRIPIISTMGLSLFWYHIQTLAPTKSIAALIISDINMFIWKKSPEMGTEEEGSGKGYRRWIREKAAVLSKLDGGLGIPDFSNQVEVIQAAAVVRYLGPAQALWKPILDLWLLDDKSDAHGRACLLTDTPAKVLRARLWNYTWGTAAERKAATPPALVFWQAAVTAFKKLEWHLELPGTGEDVLARNVFHDKHHPPPNIRPGTVQWWRNTCGIHHVGDIWDWGRNRALTVEELSAWLSKGGRRTTLPRGPTIDGRTVPEAELKKEWNKICASISAEEIELIRESKENEPMEGEVFAWEEEREGWTAMVYGKCSPSPPRPQASRRGGSSVTDLEHRGLPVRVPRGGSDRQGAKVVS